MNVRPHDRAAAHLAAPGLRLGHVDGLAQAYAWDIKARIADQGLKPEAIRVEVIEMAEAVAPEQGGVKVTAIELDHGELLTRAFGYHVDHANCSVTISGDTRFSEDPGLQGHPGTGDDLMAFRLDTDQVTQPPPRKPRACASPATPIDTAPWPNT